MRDVVADARPGAKHEGRGCCEIVARITFEVVALRDIIAPPFTSKLVRSAIASAKQTLPDQAGPGHYKRVFVSPILLRGQPIYKTTKSRGGPIVLKEGACYGAEVSMMLSRYEAERLIDNLTYFNAETPYGPVRFEVSRVDMSHLSELEAGVGGVFRLRLLTPTLLSNKLMTPPRAGRRLRESVSQMSKLLPTPGSIMAYLARLWNKNARPELALPTPSSDDTIAPYKIGRIADVILAEVDYRLRPVTVLYDKKPGGPREVRGVVGWVLYKSAYKGGSLPRVFKRLLGLAGYMGVGRSRGVGMGMVRVEPVG